MSADVIGNNDDTLSYGRLPWYCMPQQGKAGEQYGCPRPSASPEPVPHQALNLVLPYSPAASITGSPLGSIVLPVSPRASSIGVTSGWRPAKFSNISK